MIRTLGLISFFHLVFLSNSNAQQDTTFYSASNGIVNSSDKAEAHHYYLLQRGPINGLSKFYYMDHSVFAEVTYVNNTLEGAFTFYHKNGQVQETGQFQEGVKVGTVRKYFGNGQLQSVVNHRPIYGERINAHVTTPTTTFKTLLNAWDSLGNQQVFHGNGVYHGPDFDYPDSWVTGKYVNGLKEGDWKGYNKEELSFEESYIEGELTQGTSYNEDGTTNQYNMVIDPAKFPGEMAGWYKYLTKNLKYPKKAKRAGTEGTVHVSFVVNKDGSVNNVEVMSGIGNGCDEEAVRVIDASHWQPGKLRGKIVQSRMNIRLIFKLT